MPQFGLVLRTPRLELRLPSTEQLVALARQFFQRHDRMASDPSLA